MYKLSSLPIEILYLVGDFLELQDLVTVGRLNSWYSYLFSIVLGERINDCVKEKGWRIHVSPLFFIRMFTPIYSYIIII